jgi:hypothetical protein
MGAFWSSVNSRCAKGEPLKHKKKQQSRTAPQVGIIFFHAERLWIESTPLERAGNYGKCKIHDGNHVDFWEQLISQRLVPEYVEYENVPRGRVIFSPTSGRYLLLLDRCILRRKDVVAAIKRQMGLPPKGTETDTDSHYRCSECLGERGLD